MITVWHYQIGSTTATRQSEGTVHAADWTEALHLVSEEAKDSGLDPIEIYVWRDDA